MLNINRLKKLFKCLAEPLYREALLKNAVAAAIEHEEVLNTLSECKTVFDIGANRGQFALVALKCLKHANIVCCEPLEKPTRQLERVLNSRQQRVRIARVAIGSLTGAATMHVSARDDSSSLLPIGANQNRLFPGTQEIETEIVDVSELASVIGSQEFSMPALLKIDVQGTELDVLRGSETVLSRIKYVYVECSFVELYDGQALACEVIDWLQRRGLFLTGIHNLSTSGGRAIQADFLFSRLR